MCKPFLSFVIKKTIISSTIGNLSRKSPQLWNYIFPTESGGINICKKFVMNVFNITEDRIKTVQLKIANQKPLADERGNHDNHFTKLTNDIKNLIQLHCESLPHSVSLF